MKTYLSDSGSCLWVYTHEKEDKDHYGDDIIIAEINGKSNVVTFTDTAFKILISNMNI